MKGRETKGAPNSADFLVCFPSKSHLTLIPKPICSPARPSDPNKRYHHHLTKSSHRGVGGGGGGQASPILWAKAKPVGCEISEPTSPKVTCAGQIKVRPKASSIKNWQSVMEEIERLHNSKKHKKRGTMQFLTSLQRIRFDFRCSGSFATSESTSADDQGDAENEDEENPRTVFSKWFMVLQENQQNKCAPPPNALLLMRCRSAPAKSLLEEMMEDEERETDEVDKAELGNEENKTSRSLGELMTCESCDTDFSTISSSETAKTRTWLVGGFRAMRGSTVRNRSWKR